MSPLDESLGGLLSQGPVTPALAHLFTDKRGFGWRGTPLKNGLQQPDGIETDLGTAIGKLRQIA